MAESRPYRSEIRDRGQLTIPKGIRESGGLDEGQAVTIIPLGDSLLVTPKTLGLDEARREIRRIVRASGVSLDALMRGLDESRESLYRDTYGRKKS